MLHNCYSPVAPTYTKKYAFNAFLLKEAILKADTGSTKTYLQPKHACFLNNLTPCSSPTTATLPDGSSIKATQQGHLNMANDLQFPALVFPSLNSESLLSIGQLCDLGCIAVFDKNKLQIFKGPNLVLSGKRNHTDGLWDVPFRNTSDKINYIISKNKNKTELAQYLHGCAFSPTLSTLQKAVKRGNFLSWPGIEDLNFQKLLKAPLATILGHLD